ncbi:MAG: protein kinase domain-containing protein [Akkermansiaceae bacterium]
MAGNEKDIELGNYRVLKNGDGQNWELGKGAFGTTYKAEHKHLPRFCALKVINESLIRRSNSKQRFLQEAQAASLLEHPNIAQIYDFGESEGIFYYAMTYCAGHDLEAFAKANGPQPWSAVKRMAKQIFSALTEAHGKGLLHRDIKPSNIMLSENDGTMNLKLIDFGLVKVLEQSSSHKTNVLLTNEGGFLGSPLTASPEQLKEEELDERSDLFSVGVTLWYLLVGGSPFEHTSTAQLVHHRLKSDRYDNEFPDGLEADAVAILSKLLRKDQAERYTSAREVLVDLEDPELKAPSPEVAKPADIGGGIFPSIIPEGFNLESLKEQVEEVNVDWSEIWDILEIVHQDIHGTLYNCVSKQDASIRSSIYIPDSRDSAFEEVITNADKLLASDVGVLSPFVHRGEYDEAVCYLSTPYPLADVTLLVQQVGELRFSKYNHLFQSIARAIDESARIGMPGLQLSHNEIKLAFADQPLHLTKEQWVNYFTVGIAVGNEILETVEVFGIPKFVDSQSVDDVSMTLSNEDLATSTLSSFAGFIYSAVSGMKVKQSAYLTPTAHVSTSNFSEESNNYISKVIAAEIMPASAADFLAKLSEMENTSADSSASIFSTQEMKGQRKSFLIDAHKSMSGMSGRFASPTDPVAAANLAQAPAPAPASTSASNIPEVIADPQEIIEDIDFEIESFDEPEALPVTKKIAQKSTEKVTPPKVTKPVEKPVRKKPQEKVKAEEKKKSKLVPLLLLFVALAVGGYFGTKYFLADSGEKIDESTAGQTTRDDEASDKPVVSLPAVSGSEKIMITVSDLKGLEVTDSNPLVIYANNGDELSVVRSEDSDQFSMTLEPEAFAAWDDAPVTLKLKSTTHRITPIKLNKSSLTKSGDEHVYPTKLNLVPSRIIKFSSIVKFAGQEYPETAELMKTYLYPVDIGLDLKKETKGDEVTLILPMDTTFPIKTEFILPGCDKIKKSINENTESIVWEIKVSKKPVRLYGLPAYEELRFKPNLDTINEPKVKEIFSKGISSESLTPLTNGNGFVELQLPMLKGELEIISANGKHKININSDSVAVVFSSIGKSYSAEIKELISSAEAGVIDSQFSLGVKLIEGEGVEKDLKSAVGWFIMASEQGDILAKNNVASMYLHGEGVTMDQRKAVKLFKEGSDANNAESSINLGLCYLKGWGVEKNVAEAVRYYEKAAEGGVADAYGDLGVIYGQPEFGMLNLEKAVEYFTKGSDAGHGASSYNLGTIYSSGMGKVKRDGEKSIKYYKEARKQGYKPAEAALKKLGVPLE